MIVYYISILPDFKSPDDELKFNVIRVCLVLAECCKKREML